MLGARRISYKSNEFQWGNKRVVIKTGSATVVTRAMISRVSSIVYGEWKIDGWNLYEIDTDVFEKLSIQSRSRNHNENYRFVRGKQIKENGRHINVAA
jgi:hypothetical protein